MCSSMAAGGTGAAARAAGAAARLPRRLILRRLWRRLAVRRLSLLGARTGGGAPSPVLSTKVQSRAAACLQQLAIDKLKVMLKRFIASTRA